MTPKFIGEKIDVELDQDNRMPLSFTWQDTKYSVIKIKSSWQDYGFGRSPAPKRVPWRIRHHRTYYQVVTENNRMFELYYDRGGKEKTWYLVQELK
ncbi:MAG: DUF6504 family protein [bacterium]